ncbi:MAG: valine--tRNA ligase, partial [Halanaerobium sp.]|nr:valine--tRNA ligase [Halanaerobium sp.]
NLEYSTIGKESQRISQLSFLDLYEKGKVYRQQDPVIWCPECQTSIAQAEVEAEEEGTIFNYINFPAGEDGELTIATTRPELLGACVAIFVHPEDGRYHEFIGKEATVPLFNHQVPIMADEAVDPEKGSGAVMCCTFGDQQDLAWWKKYGLPLREIILEDGRLKEELTPYGGMTAVEARKAIILDLKETGYIERQEELRHQVACHERCGKPVEFLTSRQWFVRVMEEKEKLLELGEEINWYPEFMHHRYREWVENLEWDWCISRQRYFGVPFPLWYCADCGEVIIADPEQLPVNPLKDRPVRACRCGSREFIPEKDVMDTWATSSVSPLINARWQGDRDFRYPLMPMNLRPQSHDIIRTWAFYTILKTYYHLGDIPWEDILVSGFVMAGKGEKISKSKGNAAQTPADLIEEYSADVVRLWTSTAGPGKDIYFSEQELQNNRRIPVKLWNAARFVLGHLSDFPGIGELEYQPMDRWILARLVGTKKRLTEALNGYQISQARAILEEFFWGDFCDYYLEIVKERLYQPEKRGEKARRSAQQALYITLLNILKYFAIFIPHITEEIFQAYFRDREGRKSVHLLDWDSISSHKPAAFTGDEELNEMGERFLEIVSDVRRFKSDRGLSLGKEISLLSIRGETQILGFLEEAAGDLKAVCRARDVSFRESPEGLSVEIEE